MTEHAIKLMSEIRQVREQYVLEVGEGRRVWPKSIRDRIEELENLKVPIKLISHQTGVAYDTILQWRYQRKHRIRKSFHQIEVAGEISKSGTVTVPEKKISGLPLAHTKSKSVTVTVTTPEGYRIESDNPDSVVFLIVALREANRCS